MIHIYIYILYIYSPILYILNDPNSEKVFNQILIEETFAYIHISSFKDVLFTNLEQYIKLLKVKVLPLLWGWGINQQVKYSLYKKEALNLDAQHPCQLAMLTDEPLQSPRGECRKAGPRGSVATHSESVSSKFRERSFEKIRWRMTEEDIEPLTFPGSHMAGAHTHMCTHKAQECLIQSGRIYRK